MVLLVWICLVIGYVLWIHTHPETLYTNLSKESREVHDWPTEDFDYHSVKDLENEWEVREQLENEGLISVSDGELTLRNIGTSGWSEIPRKWKVSNVYNWRIKAMAKLIGESSYSMLIYVTIEAPNATDYVYLIDHDSYILERMWPTEVRAILSDTPGYIPVQNRWFTFAVERNGTIFRIYFDGLLVNETTEPSIGHLKGFRIGAGWWSTVKFEWVKIEYEVGLPEVQNRLYLLPDVAVSVVCFLLLPFAHKTFRGARLYLWVLFGIFLTGIIGGLFSLMKFEFPALSAISLILSVVAGFAVGLFFHMSSKRRDRSRRKRG